MTGSMDTLVDCTKTSDDPFTTGESMLDSAKVMSIQTALDTSLHEIETAVRDSKSECVKSMNFFLDDVMVKLESAVIETKLKYASAMQLALDDKLDKINSVVSDFINNVTTMKPDKVEMKIIESAISDATVKCMMSLQEVLYISLGKIESTMTKSKIECLQIIQTDLDTILERIDAAVLKSRNEYVAFLKTVLNIQKDNSVRFAVLELKLDSMQEKVESGALKLDSMQAAMHSSQNQIESAVTELKLESKNSLQDVQSVVSNGIKKVEATVLELKSGLAAPVQQVRHTRQEQIRVSQRLFSSKDANRKQKLLSDNVGHTSHHRQQFTRGLPTSPDQNTASKENLDIELKHQQRDTGI